MSSDSLDSCSTCWIPGLADYRNNSVTSQVGPNRVGGSGNESDDIMKKDDDESGPPPIMMKEVPHSST